MTEIQVQTQTQTDAASISIYPVRSSGASSIASSYSSSFGSVRREPGGDHSVLSEAVERLLAQQSIDQIAGLAVKTGIPSSQRATVWPQLLKTHPYVLDPCIANDFPVAPEDLDASEKRIRGDIKRLVQKTSRSLDAEYQQQLADNLRVCTAGFLAKYNLPYESGYPWVAWTLLKCMDLQELDPTVFEHAMLVFLHTASVAQPRGPGESDVAESISQFMAAFRHFMPELSAHFDQEFMLNFFVGEEWLVWWIKWFGAKAFALQDLARTWDIYFGFRTFEIEAETPLAAVHAASVEPRLLHIFCCLALMKGNSHKLMDLDQSEAHHFLTHVPVTRNFEALLVEAYGMLDKWRAHGG